jgi:hypothetical protein
MPFFLPEKDLSEKGEAIEKLRGELFPKEYLPGGRAFSKVREVFETIKSDGQRLQSATRRMTRPPQQAGIRPLVSSGVLRVVQENHEERGLGTAETAAAPRPLDLSSKLLSAGLLPAPFVPFLYRDSACCAALGRVA